MALQRSEDADKTFAMARVNLFAQASIEPVLTGPEVETLLEECRRASFWRAEMKYCVGDVVLPTMSNGLRFICTYPGESATTEPEWPSSEISSLTDGDELTWACAGQEYENIFNIEEAIYRAWLMKAAKVVPEVDTTYSGGGAIGTFAMKCGQLIQHCLSMADRYKPLEF